MIWFAFIFNFVFMLPSQGVGTLQPDSELEISTGDTAVVQKIRGQAQSYIQAVNANRNVEMNLWALATLCEASPEARNYINSVTSSPGTGNLVPRSNKALLHPFCKDLSQKELFRELATITRSEELFFAYFLELNNEERLDLLNQNSIPKFRQERDSIHFTELITRVAHRNSIDNSVLPIDNFSLLHFLLLTNGDVRRATVPNEYWDDVLNKLLTKDGSLQDASLEKKIRLFLDQTPKETSLSKTVELFTIFRILYLKEIYPESFLLYDQLIADDLFPVSVCQLNMFGFLDYSMAVLGYYDRSLYITRNITKPVAKYLGKKTIELDQKLREGLYTYRMGKISEAQHIFEETLSEAEKYNINIPESVYYNNLGLTYLKLGNIDKYLDLLYRALKSAKKQNSYDDQHIIYRNLYVAHRKNNDIKSAIHYLTRAEKLAEEHKNIEHLASIHLSFGTYYRDFLNNDSLAIERFNKAASLIDPQSNYNLAKQIYPEKARLLEENINLESALENYSLLQQLAKSKNDLPTQLEVAINMGNIYLKQGKLESVQNIIRKISAANLAQLDFEAIVKSKALNASYLIERGQKDKAYDILKPVVEQVVQRARNSTDLQSGFWRVEPTYLKTIQIYADLLIDTGRESEAVLALDQLKTINDTDLYQNPMVKSSLLSEQELWQYQELTRKLDQLRKQQLSASSQQKPDIQSQIDQLNAKKRILDRKISRMADRESITMAQVQQQLSGNDVALHITELNNLFYIATITRRSVDFKKISLSKERRTLFEEAIQGMSEGETDLNKLYEIGKILEVSELPEYAENLILIPDSYLYQLPYDIIPMTAPDHSYSYGEPVYLIEQYKTEYLTSLNELKPVSVPQKNYNWDFVGFGISEFEDSEKDLIPLPKASTEVTEISRELSNLESHRTILNENSTEQAFRNTAPNARIIHLATHSKVSEQNPLLSTIHMSNPGPHNSEENFKSQIFAYELFEMNLSTELIMLNSCESGSGSYLQGSGIVGISRALQYAGAKSLVLNLWSVNDMMASDFAIQFYRALNEGDSKSEALRKAKIHFLKQKNANPHYWGPYMLIGNSQPVVHPYQTANFLFATGFMIYLVTLVGISYIFQIKRKSR